MTNISRRAFNVGLSGGVAASLTGVRIAGAQAFSSQDVHFICGFAAGSGADVVVRFFAEKMRPMLGKAVLVENRVGAGANIATEYAARAKPDGHTVYLNSGDVLAINYNILKSANVDPSKELQSIGTIHRLPYAIVVAANSPIKTIGELVTAMKEKGEKATYGFAAGGGVKVVGALFKDKAGLKATEVSYRASDEYLNDLTSGALDYAIANNVTAAAHVRQGRVRVIAISFPERTSTSEGSPTLAEVGLPVSVIGWWGGFVPSATPRPIVDQLAKMLSAVVNSEEGQKFLRGIGTEPWVRTPDQAQAFLRQEVKDWADYVRIANIAKQ